MKKTVATIKKIISIVAFATSFFPLASLSSCNHNSDIISNLDGSNWPGAMPFSVFEPEEYVIDNDNKTVTYKSSKNFGCENFLDIPDYVKCNNENYKVIIGERCFINNSFITGKITLNKWTDSIPEQCFASTGNVSKITEIVFKQYPKRFDTMAFYNCTFLKSITVNSEKGFDTNWVKEVVSIEDSAFSKCTNLETDLIFGKDFEFLGTEAFSDCYRLKNVSFSFAKKLTSLANMSFNQCTRLEQVDLSENLRKIGAHTFDGCTSLVSVNLPVENMILELSDSSFQNTRELKSFSKKCYFKSIPDNCFAGCQSLQITPWLDQVDGEFTKIGKGAFQTCGYRRIKFLKNMPQPDELAFANPSGKTEIDSLIIDLSDFDGAAEEDILKWTVKPEKERCMFQGKPQMGRIWFKKTEHPEINQKWYDIFEIMGFSKEDFDKTKWWIEYV